VLHAKIVYLTNTIKQHIATANDNFFHTKMTISTTLCVLL